MNALLKQAAKDYYEYFVEKRFEISYSQKIESDKFIAHQNEIWGKCFVVSETMYVMALEAAEHYSCLAAGGDSLLMRIVCMQHSMGERSTRMEALLNKHSGIYPDLLPPTTQGS